MEISSVLAVLGLFMLRIGVPVVALIALGILIDRWQNHRSAETRSMYATGVVPDEVREQGEDAAQEQKAA